MKRQNIPALLLAIATILLLGALAVYGKAYLRVGIAGLLMLGITALCIGVYTRQQSLFQHKGSDMALVLLVSAALYFYLPGFLYDDAAFILRYLDHFREGYWFRYNIEDAPVYGISGFIHGLFTGLLCWTHIARPEQALFISNFTGFVFTSWFLLGIWRQLVPDRRIAVPLWIVTLVGAKMYLSVAFCGLETALHLALVTGAVYFLMAGRQRLFFLFSALMIVSKLDAVPVAAVAMLYYLGIYPGEIRKGRTWMRGVLWFLLPLAVSLTLITVLFGSPLPQSAYAKIYFHSHSKTFWFPFLLYFVGDVYHFTLLVAALLTWAITLVMGIRNPAQGRLRWSFFGSAFLGIMVLYYFYNPGERMLWYYAMPEMLLYMQLLGGVILLLGKWLPVLSEEKRSLALLLQAAVIISFGAVFAADSYGGLQWVRRSEEVIEGERSRIGKRLGADEFKGKTLMCAHGYFGRYFQGYVLDVSGLNSEITTRYRLRHDSLIADFHPDYLVNHAYPKYMAAYNRGNYEPMEVYRDITTRRYPPWIIYRRNTGADSVSTTRLDESLHTRFLITRGSVAYLVQSDERICLRDTLPAKEKLVHLGLECQKESYTVHAFIFADSLCRDTVHLVIPSLAEQQQGISRLVVDRTLDITGADSVIFRSDNKTYFEISEPLFVRRK